MRKSTNAKTQQKKWQCSECGKTFSAPQGLNGHMRYIHPNRQVAPAAGNGEQASRGTNSQVDGAMMRSPEPTDANTSVRSAGAREHLLAAVEILKKRNREIEENIMRLEALRAEKEALDKELEAVNTALRSFDAASGTHHAKQ